jgi:hypothetical protein
MGQNHNFWPIFFLSEIVIFLQDNTKINKFHHHGRFLASEFYYDLQATLNICVICVPYKLQVAKW